MYWDFTICITKRPTFSNQTNGIYQLQIFIILALIYWAFVLLIEWGFRTIAHRYQKVLG